MSVSSRTEMRKAVTYARFSTDLQSERSIDDQHAICRAFAEREGLQVSASYEDRARSGASIFGRDGLIALLAAAQSKPRQFDVLVVEHTDRLSRSMRDLSDIHDRLTFAGIEIRAVHSGGTMDTAMIGLFGLVGQMQREDGAKKVRRGLAGVVRDGRHAGGRAYGYAAVAGSPGVLEIKLEEAEIIRRVFRESLAGRTARQIAHDLNRDAVPPPRGRAWNASTIHGSAQRGNGILRNALYAGEIVWNKVGMIKDPATGRRVSRPNDPSAWQRVEAPHLAIVDPEAWKAMERLLGVKAQIRPTHQRTAKHLLSGLLRCGSCQAGMSTNGKDRSGRTRVRCTASVENGTCPDPRTFYLDTIEGAVLDALGSELRAPNVIAEYVRTYHDERKRLAGDAGKRRAALARRLEAAARRLQAYSGMLADGIGDRRQVSDDMKAAGAERDAIEAELEQLGEPEKVVALHPAVLARYEGQLERLQASLRAGVVAGDTEAAGAIRDLVRTVTVRRDDSRPGRLSVEIEGALNALLGEEHFPNRVMWGSMVAEERYTRSTQRIPFCIAG